MSAMLWRVVYAVIVVVLLLVALPLFFQVVGFVPPPAAVALLRICIAGIAILYVLRGSPFPPPPA